jgi:Pyruvate/2-oxoacid:ferredoxin oxidoreductase delta subunit
MKRKIVEIDRERCDGCGLCVPNCAEGALRIDGGKAVLVSDSYCDGLGACLGHCPRDAIRMVEREAPEFGEKAVARHPTGGEAPGPEGVPFPCPGARVHDGRPAVAGDEGGVPAGSALTQWPIQLHLVPVEAPFFRNADLLMAASCVPFACGDFHRTLLPGRSLVIACPKLDRTEPYLEKLAEIIRRNDIRSLTVAVMEVPCCQGLVRLVRQALRDSGKKAPVSVEVITIDGNRKRGHARLVPKEGAKP